MMRSMRTGVCTYSPPPPFLSLHPCARTAQRRDSSHVLRGRTAVVRRRAVRTGPKRGSEEGGREVIFRNEKYAVGFRKNQASK